MQTSPEATAVTQEQLRQRYLKQMGYTPWVLARAVPDVPQLPEIAWATPAAAETVAPSPSPSPAPAPVDTQAMLAALRQDAPAAPAPETAVASAAPVPAETPAADVERVADIALLAFQAGHCWLVVEQEDPLAPELSREGFQLVSGILKVVGGAQPGEPRRWQAGTGLGFDLPLHVARRSLELFLQGLCRHQLLPVVLLASSSTQSLLEPVHRYTLQEQGKIKLLALSSVQEMLADAEQHKRPSWQAMLQAGVARKA